jgi:hypothetical protein
MRKQRTQPSAWKIPAPFFVIVAIFLLPVNVAYANSTPPSSVVWFTFDYRTTQIPRLLGVQLIACSTTNCEQPVLLQQVGTCDRAGCVTLPPQNTGGPNDFGCKANICRSAVYPSHGGTYFELVVQFSDRVRTSGVVGKLPSYGGTWDTWRVIVRDAELIISPVDPQFESFPNRYIPKQPLLQFGLSILVEILLAGLCLQIWARTDIRRLSGRLLIILLVNLLSLPVVWFFFPSLVGQFKSHVTTISGYFFLAAALIYASLLAGIYRSGKKTRRWLIILTFISLPVTVFCLSAPGIFLSDYASIPVFTQGLTANIAILASEIFAVVFEAILITILSKRSLPLRLIWITSLLMNAASFVAGLLLNHLW